MAITLGEQCGVVASVVQAISTSPFGRFLQSRLVDSPILAGARDRFGRRNWVVAMGMSIIHVPNRHIMCAVIHRLVGVAYDRMMLCRAGERQIAEMADRFVRERGLHYGVQNGLVRQLGMAHTPGKTATLRTTLQQIFANTPLQIEMLAQAAAAAKAERERWVARSVKAMITGGQDALERRVRRAVNDPRQGPVLTARVLEVLEQGWTRSPSVLEEERTTHEALVQGAAARVKAARAEVTRWSPGSREDGGHTSYIQLLEQLRQRLQEQALQEADTAVVAAAAEVASALEGTAAGLRARVDSLIARMTSERDQVLAEAQRIEGLDVRWRAPHGRVIMPEPARSYAAMLVGEGAVSEREEVIVRSLWEQVVRESGDVLDLEDLDEVTRRLLCRAVLHVRPMDVADVLVDEYGKQGALVEVEALLHRAVEMLPLDEGEIDPDVARRLMVVSVKGGEGNPLANLIRRAGGSADELFFVDGECADTVAVNTVRFGVPVNALAGLQTYEADYKAVSRMHDEEICFTDPHFRDLPSVEPIRDPEDQRLEEVLGRGIAAGVVKRCKNGAYLYLPCDGEAHPMGPDRAAARAWLLRRQDVIVCITSRWIATRILRMLADTQTGQTPLVNCVKAAAADADGAVIYHPDGHDAKAVGVAADYRGEPNDDDTN